MSSVSLGEGEGVVGGGGGNVTPFMTLDADFRPQAAWEVGGDIGLNSAND